MPLRLSKIELSVEDLYGAAYLHEKDACYRQDPFAYDAAIKDTAFVKAKLQREASKRKSASGGAGARGEGLGGGSFGPEGSSSSTRMHSNVDAETVIR